MLFFELKIYFNLLFLRVFLVALLFLVSSHTNFVVKD